MSDINIGSRAQVIASDVNKLIRIVSSYNPEVTFADQLKSYLTEVGYASMFPNFQNLRIGNVHPFALTLLQDVLGQKIKTDVFPSITVADSTDSVINQTLNMDTEDILLTKKAWNDLKEARATKKIHISDENVDRIDAVIDTADIYGIKYQHMEQHSFDFNIWADNKDVASFLFDVVKQFLISNITDLKEEGISLQGEMQGRRSGDINVEFGKLLYGANVTVTAMSVITSLKLNLAVNFMQTFNVDSPNTGGE